MVSNFWSDSCVQVLNPNFKEEPLDLGPEDSLVVISEYEWT